jgi:hypothetical protein
MTGNDNVVALTPGVIPPGQVSLSVIQRLEQLLESARRGEITDIAVATVAPGGAVGTGWSDITNDVLLMAAIHHLRLRFETFYSRLNF